MHMLPCMRNDSDMHWSLLLSLLIVVLFAVFLGSVCSSTSVIIIGSCGVRGRGCLVVLASGLVAMLTSATWQRNLVKRQFLAEVDRDLAHGRGLPTDALHFEPLHGVLHIPNVALGRLEVLGATLACNFEPKDFGLVVVNFWRQNHSHGIVHQEDLREAGTETRSINVNLACLWQINFFTPWAKVLEA